MQYEYATGDSPVFPDFLTLTLNGKEVEFDGVVYQDNRPRYIYDLGNHEIVLTNTRPSVNVPGSGWCEVDSFSPEINFYNRVHGVTFCIKGEYNNDPQAALDDLMIKFKRFLDEIKVMTNQIGL